MASVAPGAFGHLTSFSGHERNHLFLQNPEARFEDRSALSGLDHEGDTRSFALLDYDRDGWLDVAAINANAPLLSLFRNRLGDGDSDHQSVAIRLVGGNALSAPSRHWSNRDGIGARIEAQLSGAVVLRRDKQAGEGLAAQNSASLVIGLGWRQEIESLTIYWPSGREQRLEHVAAQSELIAFERAEDAPAGDGWLRRERPSPPATIAPSSARPSERSPSLFGNHPGGARLRLYTTMATWCDACKREFEHLKRLRSHFGETALAIFGLPIDPEDSPEALAAYLKEHKPAYLLHALSERERSAVAPLLERVGDRLPASIITDGEGRLLEVSAGLPTLSRLMRHLEKLTERPQGAAASGDQQVDHGP